ncbi:MAG TPA: hypothetical protein VLH16_02780 [Bacteroidales bacterium]|nr:hypothetical protein [Bacteroidales bacterium]
MTKNKKANQNPVTRIEIKTPAIVNGVLVTQDILVAMDMLQFGGCYGRDISFKQFEPDVLNNKLADCKDLVFHLVQNAVNDQKKCIDGENLELFAKLHWMHDLLQYFKIPPKLIKKLEAQKQNSNEKES